MYTCMWSASPIVATPAMPEAPNLIQSWKITEEMIMAEMMGRLGLACRGQRLVNAQRYSIESQGGWAPGGQGWHPDLFLVSLETIWGGKLCPFIMFVTRLRHQATSALLNNFISKLSIFWEKMNNIIIPLISLKHTRVTIFSSPHTPSFIARCRWLIVRLYVSRIFPHLCFRFASMSLCCCSFPSFICKGVFHHHGRGTREL